MNDYDDIADLDLVRQRLVVESNCVDIAKLGAVGIEHKILPRLEHHFALGKLANPNFWPLQVGHDGHLATGSLRRRTHQNSPANVILRATVAEVQAHHIDACSDHLFQQCGITGGGAKRNDDFGSMVGHEKASLEVNRSFLHESVFASVAIGACSELCSLQFQPFATSLAHHA